MIDELNLIKSKETREPCNYVVEQLRQCGSSRGFALSRLKGRMGRCVWCEAKLRGRQRRWCSEICIQSAYLRCFPQLPEAKMHRLIHMQNFACAGCGESYEAQVRAEIVDIFMRWNGRKRPGQKPELVSLTAVNWKFGGLLHLDHIIPIFKGGDGIDPANLQILCVPCHKAKTIEERR